MYFSLASQNLDVISEFDVHSQPKMRSCSVGVGALSGSLWRHWLPAKLLRELL